MFSALLFILSKKITEQYFFGLENKKSANIKLKNIKITSWNNLKYFYEPDANSVEVAKPEFSNEDITYKFNNDAIRAENDYSVNKKDNVFRLITLGDSYTYGLYLNYYQTYPQILEKLLNEELTCSNIKKFELINLAYGGYDAEYAYARFIKRGMKYDPDMVIWMLNYWNLEIVSEIYHDVYQQLKLNNNNRNSNDDDKYLRAEKILRDNYSDSFRTEYQKGRIKEMIETFPKIVILAGLEGKEKVQKAVFPYLISGRVYYTNDLPDIRKSKDFYLEDGHPSGRGNKKIAEYFFLYLAGNFFKDCRINNKP